MENPLRGYVNTMGTSSEATKSNQKSEQTKERMTLNCYLKDSSGYFWYDTLKINFRERIANGHQAILKGNVLTWSVTDRTSKPNLNFSYDMDTRRYRGTDGGGNEVFNGECETTPLFD